MVELFDKLKARVTAKKEEKLGESADIEKVNATLEEDMPEGFVVLDHSVDKSTPVPPVVRATVINLEKNMPTEESLNLTKKEQPNPQPLNLSKSNVEEISTEVLVPQVVKNTGAYSQGGIKEQLAAPTTPVADVKDVPKPLINKELIAKAILFVTFTSVVADCLMYLYDIGLNGLLLLVAVTAIIQFLLVAEYRKPTMR